jgi:hypothetical protein
MTTSRDRSFLCAIAATCAFILSLRGAWQSFDYWETFPIFAGLAGTGVPAGLAVYFRARSVLLAVLCAIGVAGVTLVATFLVTCSRWCA